MKTNFLKRILSLLFTLGLVGVLLTSCEKEIIKNNLDEPESINHFFDEGETFYDFKSLPDNFLSPQEVLNFSSQNIEESLDDSAQLRSCIDIIRYKVTNCTGNGNTLTVDWRSVGNLALFVYHYRKSDNKWLGTTRINPTNASCNFRCDTFGFCPSGNNGEIKSVAFMGSGNTTYDSITRYFDDN